MKYISSINTMSYTTVISMTSDGFKIAFDDDDDHHYCNFKTVMRITFKTVFAKICHKLSINVELTCRMYFSIHSFMTHKTRLSLRTGARFGSDRGSRPSRPPFFRKVGIEININMISLIHCNPIIIRS